jgi:hypothetical protein
MLAEKRIEKRPCDVFKGDDLVYFFVGRPAFKWDSDSEAEYWELPSCLILDYRPALVRRIFPFDSGGYSKELFPGFIQMMGLEAVDLGGDLSTAQAFVGAYFINASNYFHLKPRNEADFIRRFNVDVLDHEVRALYKLISTSNSILDDRRIAIEVQAPESVDLIPGRVLAVVFPEVYLESDEFMKYVEFELGAEPLSYPIYPMRAQFYFQAMYSKVAEFYARKGFM